MSEQTIRFPSLPALQEANDRLLDALDAADPTLETPEAFWAEVAAFIRRAQATGAILDIPNERRAAQSILDYWDNALYRADRPAPGARLADFDIALAPDLTDQPCPYRGLAAFDENSAEFFFGRRTLIGQMVAKVKDGARLMVVIGPSGSGKSSVVRAGLLRALKKNGAIAGSEGWCYVSMVPGAEPVANLDRALTQAAPAPDQRTVLVVDQFEEVFTVCDDPQARLDFEARLLALLTMEEPEHIVILTLREDFVDNLSQLRALYNRYREPGVRVNVEAMDINELREVIEGPAALVGLRFEEGVVDDLASKVLGERAGLPLLQFTLLQLWEKRQRNRVTMDVYNAVGSPLEALKRSADDFYGRLLPEDQTRARNILLTMVNPGEGKEFTSNRIPLENVFGADQNPERVEQVVYRLICEARLIKLTGTDEDICADAFDYGEGKLRDLIIEEAARGNVLQIEVAHEALVRNWPKLETWLDEERQTLQARWDFRRQAERWEQSGERSEWLARGATLTAASAYPNLSPLEQRFAAAGRRAERVDRLVRIGGLAAVIGFALLTALVLWRTERVRTARVAVSRTAAQALIADDKELEERLGWALKAYYDQHKLDQNREVQLLEKLTDALPSPADAPGTEEVAQGTALAELLESRTVEGLGVEDGLRSALRDAPILLLHRAVGESPPDAARAPADALALSGPPQRDASRSLSGNILDLIRGRRAGGEPQEPLRPSNQVLQIVASPGGDRLATLSLMETGQGAEASPEGGSLLEVALWELAAGHPPETLRPAVMNSGDGDILVFSEDGSRVAGIGADNTVYVWDPDNPTTPLALPHGSIVNRIWFGPSGSGLLASATLDQQFHLWNLSGTGDDNREVWSLESHLWPPQLAFSSDGRSIAAAVESGSLCLIDLVEAAAEGTAICSVIDMSPIQEADDVADEVSDLIGCPEGDCFYAAMQSGALQVCDAKGCQQPSNLRANLAPTDEPLHFSSKPYCSRPAADSAITSADVQGVPGNLLESTRDVGDTLVRLGAYRGTEALTLDVRNPISPSLVSRVIFPTEVQAVLLRSDCEVLGVVAAPGQPRVLGETGGILYDAATGDELAQVAIERSDARQLYNVGDGIGVASADRDDFIRLWAFARRGDSEPLWRSQDYESGPAISPDGGWAVTGNEGKMHLADLANRDGAPIVLEPTEDPGLQYGMAEDILLGPQGRLLLWRDFEGSAHLVDTANEKELARIEQDTLPLSNFAFADGRLVALDAGGILRTWDTTDPTGLDITRPVTVALPVADVQALALSLDGRWLATAASGEEYVRIWDLRQDTTTTAATVPVGGTVQALALDRDAGQLAVMHASPEDPTLATRVTVWDTDTGRQIADMRIIGALPTMAFGPASADGEADPLITAQGNETATIYRQFVTVEALARRAAEIGGCRLETECAEVFFQRLRERGQMREE